MLADIYTHVQTDTHLHLLLDVRVHTDTHTHTRLWVEILNSLCHHDLNDFYNLTNNNYRKSIFYIRIAHP
jgi:hypothetical protein